MSIEPDDLEDLNEEDVLVEGNNSFEVDVKTPSFSWWSVKFHFNPSVDTIASPASAANPQYGP